MKTKTVAEIAVEHSEEALDNYLRAKTRKRAIKSQKETEKLEAIEKLRGWIAPGQTVYTALRHVSRSGMMRHISVVIIQDGKPRDISYSVASALEYSTTTNGHIRVGGAGMDMGYSIVHSLSVTLFMDGYGCLGDRCPSNAHRNYRGNPDDEPRGKGVIHRDGYALRHEWI